MSNDRTEISVIYRGENRLMFCAAIFYDVFNFHLFQ